MSAKYKWHKALIEGKLLINAAGKLFTNLDANIGFRHRKKYTKKVKTVPNQIFFNPFQGAYTCNPKYIFDELVRRKADVKLVWGLKNPASLPDFGPDVDVSAYKINTIDYFKAAMASKFIITNGILGGRFKVIPIRPDQVVIETWHGSLGLKRIDANNYKTTKDWPKAMRQTGKYTTYAITNSTFEEDVFRTSFWGKKSNTKFLMYGHARNDVLFESGELKKKVRENIVREFNLPKNEDIHFVLYAPTFRDDHNFAVYNLDFNRTLNALKKRFGGEWYMLLRYHPTVLMDSANKNTQKSSKILNVTSYPDIQELMLIADAGISDYSSWMFDHMLTKRPIFIYAADYDLYKNERGFYYPINTTPFPIAENNDQMESNILSFDNDKYLKDTEAFLKDKGCMEDGKACERIVDLILSIIEEDKKKAKK